MKVYYQNKNAFLRLISGVVFFLLVMILYSCGGGSSNGEDGLSEKFSQEIDTNGGSLLIPVTEQTIGGLQLDIPSDALDNSALITVQAVQTPSDKETPRKWAEAEPELYLAVVSYALENLDDALMHPLYGPRFALSSAEFSGPGIRLGPEGQQFNEPVTLSFPLEIFGLTETSNVMPFIQAEDGTWEVVEDFYIDEFSGVAVVELSHFSLLKWIKNLIAAPDTAAQLLASGAVQSARASLPQDTFNEFVSAAVCSGENPSANLNDIPGLLDLLDYLGFEHGAVRTGQEADLAQWIRDKFQQAQAGTISKHSISLGEVFRQAMIRSEGDIFQALVTSHNVLRDNRNSVSIQDMIENYRGDGGDERGARYHYFGMALYSFAYEYYLEKTNILRDSGKLVIGTEAFDPRAMATLEEGIVSGDILSDVTEYAVDLQGAELGRQLYRQLRNAQVADLASQFGVNLSQCDTLIGVKGWAVFRITNYGSAPGGYITIDEVGTELDPPLIRSYPGGGIDPNLRAVFERVDATAFYATVNDAAKSVCSRVKDFFRPSLASFILMADFDSVRVGIDTIFQQQCS